MVSARVKRAWFRITHEAGEKVKFVQPPLPNLADKDLTTLQDQSLAFLPELCSTLRN